MLAIFITHPLDWAVNNGVGQNLTAGVIVFALGFAWAHTKYWPLRKLHQRLDRLHDSHEHLHESHAEMHRKLDALLEAQGVSEVQRDSRE